MSTIIQPSPSTWGLASFGRMSSVEELDSSLTLLSRHAVLGKNLPMTPPGTPLVARSPEQTNSRFDYSPDSPSVRIPPNTPITPSCAKVPQLPVQYDVRCVPSSSTTNGANVPTPNVAAIDNKIEQAMDLVKTHLTFAVREEVEVLRQTITDLEQRVSALESENQLLRQYAPVEVVNNLASLVQQQKAASIPPVNPASTLLQALPPPKVPTGFCSSSFATSLNNVVADVRHEFTSQNAMNELQGPLTKH